MIFLGFWAALAGCDVPFAPTDETPVPATRIDGWFELDSFGDDSEGDAVLLRYDCDEPPPPAGGGSPVDFLLVGESAFVDGRAPFSFSSIPPESCSIVSGFVDRDDDFHYALGVMAQATAGDIALSSVQRQVGAVEGDTDFIEPASPVLLRALAEFTTDPPAYRLAGWPAAIPTMSLGATPLSTAPVQVEFLSTTVSTDMLSLGAPAFSVVLGADEDGDGLPDDDNGDGLPDIDWPIVQLQRLDGEASDGSTSDPPVVLVGVTMALDPQAPSQYNLLAAAAAQGVAADGYSVLTVQTLRLVIPGLVLASTDPVQLVPIENVVAAGTDVTGIYRILMIEPDGRVWYLPNELAEVGVPSQAGYFRIEPPAR